MPDEFLTVDQVAKLLKLNAQTIRNMVDRGELGAVHVGQRRVRIRQSELDRFLAAGETRASAQRDEENGELEAAVADVLRATRAEGSAELVSALRALAAAAERLAAALEDWARLRKPVAPRRGGRCSNQPNSTFSSEPVGGVVGVGGRPGSLRTRPPAVG